MDQVSTEGAAVSGFDEGAQYELLAKRTNGRVDQLGRQKSVTSNKR